jgi:succinoglycan biosynthesis transport protein ExoP
MSESNPTNHGQTAPPSGPNAPRSPVLNNNASHAKGSLAAPINAIAILKALRRRWLAASLLGTLAAAAVFAAVWFFLPPPNYTASTKFLIPIKPQGTLYDHPEGKTEFDSFAATQVAIIKSQMVLNAALRQPEIARLEEVHKAPDPVAWLEKEVRIDNPNGREILRLSVESADRETCKALVAAVSAAYLQEVANEANKRRQDRLDVLKTLTEKYETKLKKLREALRERGKPVGGGSDVAIALKQLESHEAALAARQELVAVESRLRNLTADESMAAAREPSNVEVPAHTLDDFVNKRPEIAALLAQKAQLEADVELMKPNAVGGINHPEVRKLIGKAEIISKDLETRRAALRAECEKQLQEQTAGAAKARASQLRQEIEAAKALRTTLLADIERLSKEARDFGEAALDMDDLKPQLAEVGAVAARSAQEAEMLSIEQGDPLRVTQWEEVVVTRPDELDRKIKTAGMGAGGACLLALLLVGFLEFHAKRVFAPQEVVRGLGMKLVGTVPARPSLRRTDRDGRWRALLTESVDSFRTMLLHGVGTDALRTIMITSAVGGEAKTSLAGHLAVSMARSGRKTLLIDGDLRNPAVYRLFDVAAAPGLSELLRGETQLSDVLRPTAVPGLHVLAAGIYNAATLARLAGDDLGGILAQLKESFDCIILDSSPVLPVTDSLLLARHVDGVVFSVLQNVSTLPAVGEAYQCLASLNVVLLGAVVSGARPDIASYGRHRYLTLPAQGQ